MNASKKQQKMVELSKELQVAQNELRTLKVLERAAVFALFAIFMIAMAVFGPLDGAFVTFGFGLLFAGVIYWRRRPHATKIRELRQRIASSR